MADRVTFTPGSAERIAKVVRIVEAGNRDSAGLPTAPRFGDLGRGGVRFCSWTATWTYAGTATIRFDPATNATATATNVILGVGPGQGWVAKKGTASWCLIGFDMTKQAGYASGDIQLFGHSTANARAQWYSITTCATATA
jgi:hypothetical protein